MEKHYIAQLKNTPRKQHYSGRMMLMVLVLLLSTLNIRGQATNPAISALPYSFTTYTGSSFPASLSVGLASSTTLVTTDFTTNAANGSSAGQWDDEGANGVSYLGSSSNESGCFKVRMNTTGLANISISWTGRRITNGTFASNYMELQWRNGNTGAWNNVANDQFSSDNTSTSFSIFLPVTAENLADLQIRWIYYDNLFLFGSRDRVAVDDIFICSAPSVTAGNNGPVCAGAALNLTSTPNGMTSYQWIGPNSFTNSNQNPVLASATGAMSGTYTVTVTNSVGCSNSATTSVTVNAPTASASSNSPICSGNAINLSTTNVSGATYQWDGPNSFSSTSRTPSINNSSSIHAGTYTVTVTIGSCTATSSVNVVVNTTPTISASNNGPICAGSTLNLTATSSGGTFAWSGPASFSSTLQNPSRTNATGAMSGTYTVTVTSSGCTASSTTNVTINAPSASPSSNSPVCSGNTINLSTPSVSGASYQWSGPNSFSSTSRTPSITNSTALNSGTYTVTVTLSGCTATSSTNVTVNTTPTVSAGSDSPVCAGSTLNLTATGSGGTFAWSGPNSFSSTSQNPTVLNVTSAAAGTYTVTVTSSGCTATSSTSVSISPGPTGTPIASSSSICSGSTINLYAGMVGTSTTTQSNTTDFVITDATSGGVITPISSPITVSGLTPTVLSSSSIQSVSFNINHAFVRDLRISLRAPNGTLIDLVRHRGGSGNNFTNTTLVSSGGANGNVSGGSAPFSGTYNSETPYSALNGLLSNGTYNLVVRDTQNADQGTLLDWTITLKNASGLTYSWTSTPSGFSSTLAEPTDVISQTTSYNVTATLGSCSTTQSVNVNAIASPDPSVSSNAPICTGNDINFSADNIASGQSSGNTYSWKNPSNVTFSTQQNPTINNGTVSNNGNYTVTITNQFLCTASAVVPVVVNPNPVLSIVSQQNESCPGANDGSLTVNAASGTPAYNYTYDFIDFNGTGIFTNLVPGPITIYVSDDNGCNGNISTTILSPNTPAAISCGGPLNINTDAGLCSATVSYAQLLAQLTSVTGFPAPVVTFSPDAGSFSVGTTTVTATATNSCGVESCTFDVLVTDAELPTITCPADGNVSVDAGQCTANSVGSPLTSDNCGVATVIANPSGPYALGSHTIVWTVTDVHGNVNSCTQNVTVIDTENPIINGCPSDIVVSNDLGTCGAVVNYVAPGATDNCTLASIIGDHNSGEVFPIGTTTVTYTATDAANNVSTCSFTITVNGTNPTAVTTISSNADFNNICLGSSIQLTANGGSLGNMNGDYKWYTSSCGGILVGTGSTLTVSPTASTTYFVRVEDGCGNITACASVLVTVSTSPVTASVTLPFTGMPSNICNGSVVSLSIPSVNKATRYIWDAPAGAYFNGNPLNVSPFATTAPNVSITYGNPSGSLYSTGVQASNACGSSLRKIQKSRGIVSVPAYVSGQTTVCENSSLSYTTPDVDGASTYLWSVTGDATVTGNSNMVTVNFGPTWNGGTLCVAAQTACYTSPTKCISLDRSAALLSNLSGSFTACPNANQTFSVNPSSGAATYAWSLPSGASGSSSTNSINVSFGSSYNSAGNICVSVTSICGVTSAPKCKTVAPGLPSMPSSVSGPLNGLCGQTVVYQCPTQSGTTFNWSVPAGAIINTGQGTNAVSVTYSTLSTSPLCVTASNSCGSSNSRCVTAKGAPNSPSSLTASPGSWCANTQGVEFTANLANTTGSYTLNWLYPSAPVANYVFGGGNSTSLILDWGTGNGNVVVVASNTCGSGSKAFNVNISCREGEAAPAQNIFSVYPNPASTIVNVQFNSADNSDYRLQLTDLSGRLILDKAVEAHSGLNTQQIDIKQMAKGVYMLVLNGSELSQKQRIVLE